MRRTTDHMENELFKDCYTALDVSLQQLERIQLVIRSLNGFFAAMLIFF
jgi:hypothetical protein